MEEYPIAMTYRTSEGRRYWIMIIGKAEEVEDEEAGVGPEIDKSKLGGEGEHFFIRLLSWSTHFSWRIVLVVTIYITILLTLLLFTKLSDPTVLFALQQICLVFFGIDIIFAVLHRVLLFRSKIPPTPRKCKLLALETLTILPITLVYVIASEHWDREVAFYLSTILFLQFYRIPQFFSEEAKAAGKPHLKLTIFEYSLYLFLSLFTFSVLWARTEFILIGYDDIIKEEDESIKFFMSLYFSLVTLTNTGFGDVLVNNFYEKIICACAMLLGFALTSGTLVGAMTTHIIRAEKPREKYRREYETTQKKIRTYGIMDRLQLKLLTDLNDMWKYKKGITENNTFNLFPIPLRKEISFDIAFGFLNRSLIFNTQDRSFLRSVSIEMKNKTYLPGDDIIRPSGIYSGMMCVAAGVIEILSDENDDTPIISFTSGTILGEISLFMPRPVTTVIRAATFVELQVLDAISFYRLALKYPLNYKSMREEILYRYRESRNKHLSATAKLADFEGEKEARRKVLKYLIEDLQQDDDRESEESTSSDILRTKILNLYVWIENLPRVKTLPITLIRTKPWILRPDTSFTNTWSHIMFLTVTIVIFLYPYMAVFVRELDPVTTTIFNFIQAIYVVDLCLQCLTAIPRKDLISYKTSIIEIILTRLKSYGFYLDVISTYDFGVFSGLFHFAEPDHVWLLLSQNKLLRVWKIPIYFKDIENELPTNLLIVRIVKYCYFTLALINLGSALLYMEACPLEECYPDRWFSALQEYEVKKAVETPLTKYPYVVSLYFSLMATSTSGFGNIRAYTVPDCLVVIILMIGGLITFNWCIAELSVTFKHRERRKSEFQEEIFAIERFLDEHDLPKNLRKRVRKYFQTQWDYNQGAFFKKDIPMGKQPKKIQEMIYSERLLTLKVVPLFKNANQGFMMVLAKGCNVRVLPEHEMVVYAGELDREMYILQSGYCEVTDRRKPSVTRVIGPLTSFGDLEMIQGVPMSMSVKTLTHARLICIEYATYLRAVTKYPDVRRDIETLMEEQKVRGIINTTPDPYEDINRFEDIVLPKKPWHIRLKMSITQSVINVYKYDKRLGQDYWQPFASWGKFSFFKYLFLPYTLRPYSIVLHIWMVNRIVVSVLMGIVGPIFYSLATSLGSFKSIIISLQALTWLDLYITFHVAYFDKRGVLVFHPAKTIVYYLKHGFFLDFVVVFPIYWVLNGIFQPDRPSLFYHGPGLIKVFQFYKVLQALNHLENNILKRTALIKLLKFITTIIIINNFLAGLLILTECHIVIPNEKIPNDNTTQNTYRRIVLDHCTSPNVDEVTLYELRPDLTMFLIAFYWITLSMTSCGFGDIVSHDSVTTVFCITVVLLGTFLYGCMFASIASSRIFAHHIITRHRTRMREMMRFLDRENINPTLQKRFFRHFLHNWNRTLGYTPQETLSHIHTSLKQDIVDRMYEKTLRMVTAFRFTDKSFMRSIGKYIDEIYFLRGETIVKYNHIQKDLYIIYTGKVDVLNSEDKIITTMGAGGVFGNIAEKPFALCSITAIANTKVELIRLGSEDFQKTLQNYPAIKKKILSLTVDSPDFMIPFVHTSSLGLDDFDTDIPDDYGEAARRTISPEFSELGSIGSGRLHLKGAIYRHKVGKSIECIILYDSWLYSLISFLTVIFSFVTFIITTYIFAFQDSNFTLLVVYLVMDVFFYLRICLEFHCSYFDRHGDNIYSKRAIRKRYMSSRRFAMDVFGNFPIDLLVFAAPSNLQFIVFSFLRLNRLLRFHYIVEYYKNKTNTLMINTILLEIGMLFAWVTVFLHIYACIWYMAACPIFFCCDPSWLKNLNMEDHAKSEIYLTSLYFVIALLTTTGYGDIVPISVHEIFITTIMLIAGHFVMVLGTVTFVSTIGVNTLNFEIYEENIKQLRRDLQRQHMSNYLLKKLWTYLQLIWIRENGKQMPEFIVSAPYIMKCDVFNEMYGEHLSRSFIFADLENTFLRQLAIHMVRCVVFPGNYIVQQGDNDGTMYFIHRGEVSVMTIHLNLMETIHYNVRDNDQFGMSQGLVIGLPHEFSYRAETEAEILSLTLDHWQYLFKYYPAVKPIIYGRLERMH